MMWSTVKTDEWGILVNRKHLSLSDRPFRDSFRKKQVEGAKAHAVWAFTENIRHGFYPNWGECGCAFIQSRFTSSHALLRISQLTRFCIRVMADVFNNVLIIFKRCGWMHTWASEGSFPGGGSIVDFPEIAEKNFRGAPKNGKISFFRLETKKTTFFC